MAHRPDTTIDAAALLGATVAISVSLVSTPGPWTVFGMLLGLTVVAVLVGFTNLEVARRQHWIRLVPIAAVYGLAGAVALGYGFQELVIRHHGTRVCKSASNFSECLGEQTTKWLSCVWGAVFLLALVTLIVLRHVGLRRASRAL
jgi:hypothetical protein